MIRTNLFEKSDSREIVVQKKCFAVLEYKRDLSISPETAEVAYFASEMNVRKKQLIIRISSDMGVYAQSGLMQLILGDIETGTGVKGAGDFLKKVVEGAVTKETIVKPFYSGEGFLVLEPTYRYIILEDLEDWEDGIVIEDGMFLACEESVRLEVVGRKNLSSAVLGREGFFNTALYGTGLLALESPVPQEELIIVDLENDILKIDGNMAVAWSPNLKFSVHKTTKTLIGSMVSGEGFVNVYEGTGKVLIAPVRSNVGIATPETKE